MLLARRRSLLDQLAEELREQHRVEARTVTVDLGEPGAPADTLGSVADLEIGLLVYNAAFAPIGGFLDRPVSDSLRAVAVNAAAPIALVHGLATAMVGRGRGGIILMSSIAGLQGAPFISAYGATKAFTAALGEGLWYELRPLGIDVLTVLAGAVRTPGLDAAAAKPPPGSLEAAAVVSAALDRLERGPTVVPGALNLVSSHLLRRLLPRRTAVALMGAQTRRLISNA